MAELLTAGGRGVPMLAASYATERNSDAHGAGGRLPLVVVP